MILTAATPYYGRPAKESRRQPRWFIGVDDITTLRTTPQGMSRIDIVALLLDDCYKLANSIDTNNIPVQLMRVAGECLRRLSI